MSPRGRLRPLDNRTHETGRDYSDPARTVRPVNAAQPAQTTRTRQGRLTSGVTDPMLASISSAAREGRRTSQLGVTMSRRPSQLAALLLPVVAAAVLVAGCGSSASPTAQPDLESAAPSTAGSPSSAGSDSTVPSGSPAVSGSGPAASAVASPTDNLGLQHVDTALEGKLPNIIGNVQLEKMSLPLSTYIASSQGGDKALYTPWLVGFGKTPDEVNVAIATDLTQTENFFEQAIEVPGATAAVLSSSFSAEARARNWPVSTLLESSGLPKTVLQITDPEVNAAGGLGTAYVYASGDVLYIVVTDDASLLVEALIKLP
jgi:hypothetical protein